MAIRKASASLEEHLRSRFTGWFAVSPVKDTLSVYYERGTQPPDCLSGLAEWEGFPLFIRPADNHELPE